MEKGFNELIETLRKLEGINIINSSLEDTWIHFNSTLEKSVNLIINQINEIKEQYQCNLLVLIDKDKPNEFSYQLLIEDENKLAAIICLTKKIINIVNTNGDVMQSNYKELGISDLSFSTIKQMALELKQRSNLTFAIIWIDSNENNRDKIAIEGSGNPTQLVGLLSRGTHMAIEWADKNSKLNRSDAE